MFEKLFPKPKPAIVWICGQITNEAGNPSWEFQGAFSDEIGAVGACRDEYYFVAPALLDESLQHETEKGWPGLYFPLKSTTKVSA